MNLLWEYVNFTDQCWISLPIVCLVLISDLPISLLTAPRGSIIVAVVD